MWRLFVTAAICAATIAPAATASELVDRNASGVRLAVNGRGEALITYAAHGRLKHVLAWGAINALSPSLARPQVSFRFDYAGGFGKYHRAYWKSFGNRCGAYTGQPIAWLVAACTAPDGTTWALQAWQRSLPDYGVFAPGARSAWDLRLSHWTGLQAALTVKTDWTYRRFDHLYGSLTYRGKPVYGFRTTGLGNPLDGYGRLIYVDTFGSRYGAGWRRENSFVPHRPSGIFCYGFFPHGSHPTGKGARYRATAIGPGVTPDIMWQGAAPGPYDRAADEHANAEQRASYSDRLCRPN
jgi:hypothetical protein